MLAERRDIQKKDRLLLKLILFIPCVFVLFKSLDNDIWFLLNHGRYVWSNGIPLIEPFTIHEGFNFVMQQWLSASIFWAVYDGLGEIWLKILIMLNYVAIICVFYKLCMKVSKNFFFVSYVITLFASFAMLLYMVSRPQIFTALIIILALYFLESYAAEKKTWYLYTLPVLSLLLINLNAAVWPMLFVIFIPYIIEAFTMKNEEFTFNPNPKTLFAVILLFFIAGALNPYGVDAMTYITRSFGYYEISTMVNEMKPISINTVLGMLLFGSMLIVVLTYSMYRKGTTKLRYVLLTIGTAALSISSIKSYMYFILCGVFPVAYYLRGYSLPVKERKTTKRTLLLRKVLIGMNLVLIISCVYKESTISKHKEYEYSYLRDAINYVIEQKSDNTVLYTGYNEGGTAEFMQVPSYIDPRAEVFVKKNNGKADVMKEYIMLQTGRLYYKDVLDKYEFTHILINENDILYTYLKHDDDYKITYSNKNYTIYEPACR